MMSNAARSAAYQIIVEGQLDASWAGWFDGMAVAQENLGDGTPLTILTGTVSDQAALRGLLSKIWDLNLSVVSVNRVSLT
jgi:hypothetical protein